MDAIRNHYATVRVNMIKILNKLRAFLQLAELTGFISLKDLRQLKRRKKYEPGQIKTKLGLINYPDASTFITSLYEIFIDEIYKVKGFPNKNPVVIDCGANIGLSAIYFSQTYNAEVYAFEADPSICECLKKNVKNLCAPLGKINPINKAIWTNDNGIDFDIEGGHSGQIHRHGHDLVKCSTRVPSVSLRETISNFSHVDFLKIDIEGAENQVILDCADVLDIIDYIFIEWHSISSDPQMLGEILNLLKKEGFRYHIKEAFTSSSPFVNVTEMCGMDLQLNIFAFK